MNIIPNNFIGIDLGTTNSVICSYDGEHQGQFFLAGS